MSGRKRHILVDKGGLVLKALVHAANVTDRVGGQQVVAGSGDLATVFPRLRHLWVDSAYQGRFKDWVEQVLSWTVTVVQRPPHLVWAPADQDPPPDVPTGFQLRARR